MTFAHIQFLLALLFIPGAAFFLEWARRKRQQALSLLGNPALISRLTASVNWRGRRWRTALWLLALALLVVSIARPQWGTEERQVQQEGLQVIVALDVSQSMLAQDVKPNRLERAKLEIADLTQRLDGDEIGVVLFSGASFLQVPLTSDYNTALNYLDSAGPQIISRPGTVIGDAINTAMASFDDQLDSQQVLVVMTDGEDVESDPLAAAQAAADQGVLIYTIGFGTADGQPVPETDAYGRVIGTKTDAQGNPVLSHLDDNTLSAVAEIGNGQYYRATAGGQELDALLSEIDGLQEAQLRSRLEVRYIERFQIFLALGLIALLIAELIPDRLPGRNSSSQRPGVKGKLKAPKAVLVTSLLALTLVVTACSPSAEKLTQSGNDAFAKQAYEEALAAYQQAQLESPNLAEPHYNAANALYRKEQYQEALSELQKALQYGGAEQLAHNSYFNLGNNAYKLEDWATAVDSYREALMRNPDDQDAKHNLELALQQLQKEQDQQENQDQSQDQQQGQQENQEQQQDQPNGQQPGEQADQEQPTNQELQQNQQPGQEGQPPPDAPQQPSFVPAAGQRLTEEQARQLLAAIAQNSETLQERLGQYLMVRGRPPLQDW